MVMLLFESYYILRKTTRCEQVKPNVEYRVHGTHWDLHVTEDPDYLQGSARNRATETDPAQTHG
jgi:hypothetical protein